MRIIMRDLFRSIKKEKKKNKKNIAIYGAGKTGIQIASQLSFDKDYKQFPCKCGAKNCVGYIVREGSRWRIKRRRKQ